jgi:hypothetical protein
MRAAHIMTRNMDEEAAVSGAANWSKGESLEISQMADPVDHHKPVSLQISIASFSIGAIKSTGPYS